MNVSKEELDKLGLADLKKLCVANGIAFNDGDDAVALVATINESGKNKGAEGVVAKVRKHKTLGEFKKVIVHLTRHAQANTQIYASINSYTVEFKPEVEVEIPQAIIDFLKNSYVVEHYFDANAISENGNKGAHKQRHAKKYIVEPV